MLTIDLIEEFGEKHSKEIISNQVLRATRLESVVRKRKEDLAKISNKNL